MYLKICYERGTNNLCSRRRTFLSEHNPFENLSLLCSFSNNFLVLVLSVQFTLVFDSSNIDLLYKVQGSGSHEILMKNILFSLWIPSKLYYCENYMWKWSIGWNPGSFDCIHDNDQHLLSLYYILREELETRRVLFGGYANCSWPAFQRIGCVLLPQAAILELFLQNVCRTSQRPKQSGLSSFQNRWNQQAHTIARWVYCLAGSVNRTRSSVQSGRIVQNNQLKPLSKPKLVKFHEKVMKRAL